MKLRQLIEELGKDYELKEPIPEVEADVWQIPLDEDLNVVFTQPHSNHIELTAILMEAPTGKEEDLYARMLSGNLFGQGTKDAVLSISDDSRKLTLSRTIEYDVSFKEFKEILDDFINSVDFWREEALNYQ